MVYCFSRNKLHWFFFLSFFFGCRVRLCGGKRTGENITVCFRKIVIMACLSTLHSILPPLTPCSFRFGFYLFIIKPLATCSLWITHTCLCDTLIAECNQFLSYQSSFGVDWIFSLFFHVWTVGTVFIRTLVVICHQSHYSFSLSLYNFFWLAVARWKIKMTWEFIE